MPEPLQQNDGPAIADRPLNRTIPKPRVELVGRTREVSELRSLLLQPEIGVVSLIGPGGVGKTHLAYHVASLLEPQFPDGVVVVELSNTTEAAQVIPAIAHQLGEPDPGRQSFVAHLCEVLGSRQMLMVLDNLEQVIDSAIDLDLISRKCPSITFLITSRIRPHVPHEHVYILEPLKQPEAVALYVARARASAGEFTLTKQNADYVAKICDRVDGLPLAIELAAARTPVLTPEMQLARLEPSLELLSGVPRRAALRHSGLRSAIGWSYELLSDLEQRVFARCAVFTSGFDLEGAERIGGRHEDQLDIITVLSTLVDANLVKRLDSESANPRFGMLRTIRDFGLEALQSQSDADDVVKAFIEYCLKRVEHVSDLLSNEQYGESLKWLDEEVGNVRQALFWAYDRGDSALALSLSSSLARYWAIRGRYGEGRYCLGKSLDLDDLRDPQLSGEALRASGWLARLSGDTSSATEFQLQALELGRRTGDNYGVAAALQELALTRMHGSQHELAVENMLESLALFRDLTSRGDRESEMVGVACANVGQVLLASNRPQEAVRSIEESLKLQRGQHFSWALADTLRIHGDALFALGDLPAALQSYRESLSLVVAHEGDRRFLGNALSGIAMVYNDQGHFTAAVKMYAWIASLLRSFDAGIEDWQSQRHQAALAHARSRLPANARLTAEGLAARMSQQDVLALAYAADDGQEASLARQFKLTRREIEVLSLLAEGKTDREIAATMFISARTVGGHVANIFSKLGVESRTAAVTRAFAVGMVQVPPGLAPGS